MTNFRAAMCLLILVQFCLLIGQPASADNKPKLRKSSGIGSAYGFVLDAATHQYLTGATVSLSLPSDMEPIKNSHGITNQNGYYEIKASLGQSNTHFALDRIGNLSLGNILSGGEKQVDRILSASQLCLTVSKVGYKTFYGVVPLEYANADKFRVSLCPVYLRPETQKYVSYVDTHLPLAKIEDVELSSQFVAPDDVIHFTVKATGVPVRPNARINLECYGSKGGDKEVVQRNAHSDIVYRSDYRIDKHSYNKPGLYLMDWSLMNSDFTPVSCTKSDTIIVVGCEPDKKQEINKLLMASSVNGCISTGRPSTFPVFMLVRQLRVSQDFLTRIAALMPVGADLSSLQATGSSNANTPVPQTEDDFNKKIAFEKEQIGDLKKNEDAQIELANLYYRHGDYEQAKAHYELLFQNSNIEKRKDFYLFHNYAAILLRQGRDEEANRYFSLALNNAHAKADDNSAPTSQIMFGTNSYTLYNGAENKSVNGFAYVEAVSDELIIENGTAKVPTESNWLYATILGKAMNDIGLTSNSLDLLKQVAHIEPNEPQVLFALAATETSAKQYADALETVRHGLSFNPNDEDALSLEKKLNLENNSITKSVATSRVPVKHFILKHKVRR